MGVNLTTYQIPVSLYFRPFEEDDMLQQSATESSRLRIGGQQKLHMASVYNAFVFAKNTGDTPTIFGLSRVKEPRR